MKAVMSLWTKPYLEKLKNGQKNPFGFPSETDYWMSWALSILQARKYIGPVTVYTDRVGAEVLKTILDMPIGGISLALEEHAVLQNTPWQIWTQGKLVTYQEQREPFIHFDSDVFFWKPPEFENTAKVPNLFAQSPETVQPEEVDVDWGYYPERLISKLNMVSDVWEYPRLRRAYCMGICGGMDYKFFQRYAMEALNLISANTKPLREILSEPKGRYCIHVMEQYLFALMAAKQDKEVTTLFRTAEGVYSPYDEAEAAEKGYTHLIAGSKMNPKANKNVEVRVQKQDSLLWQRIINFNGLSSYLP